MSEVLLKKIKVAHEKRKQTLEDRAMLMTSHLVGMTGDEQQELFDAFEIRFDQHIVFCVEQGLETAALEVVFISGTDRSDFHPNTFGVKNRWTTALDDWVQSKKRAFNMSPSFAEKEALEETVNQTLALYTGLMREMWNGKHPKLLAKVSANSIELCDLEDVVNKL